jgi:phage/plasmid-like protein (TIGR03299 family)
MSQETLTYLRENILVGFTEKRGRAWHAARGADDENGNPLNHFTGPVPIEAVRKLMSYPLVEGAITATILNEDGVLVIEDSDRKAIVRADTGEIFLIPSNSYKIHQPEEWLVNNLDLILDGGLEVGSAGLLKGGRRAFVQAELSETRVAGGTGAEPVKHRPFLAAATSHDGSLATTYLTGSTVIVCDNTLSAALRESDSLTHKIRHSANSLNRVHEVRENLGLVVEQIGDVFDAQVEHLTSQYVSDQKWAAFLKAYSNPSGRELEGRSKTMADGKVAGLNRLYNYDERVAPWKSSAYGVLAAVNTFVHHEQTVKGMPRAERNADRLIQGEFDKIDAATLNLLARV